LIPKNLLDIIGKTLADRVPKAENGAA